MSSPKLGRNEPCHCGSGKKFKKCHGAFQPARVSAPTEIPLDATSGELSHSGFPGEHQNLTLVNTFRSDLGIGSTHEGDVGKYDLVFVLVRPCFAPKSDREVDFDLAAKGNSHVSISSPRVPNPGVTEPLKAFHIHSRKDGKDITFKCVPNAEGFMASIETTIKAGSFEEAESVARAALNPYLSTLSATLHVPLYIHQLRLTEQRTKNVRLSHTVPFAEAPASMAIRGAFKDEFLWFAALFREALNSNSPLYRFLCIFKVVEGIRIRRAARGHKPIEMIPSDPDEFRPWIDGVFPVRPVWDDMTYASIFVGEAIGKSFGAVIDQYLRPLRNDIGHLFDDSANLRLWVDHPSHVARVNYWSALAACIARWMMRDEFPDQFLTQLPRPNKRANRRATK